MNHRGFRGWKWLGGLATVALLGAGCSQLPVTGGGEVGDPGTDFFGGMRRNVPADYYSRHQQERYRGFNGTIAQLGSSIDPRTPEKEGTPGRSRQQEVSGWSPPGEGWEQGIGGSGSAGSGAGSSDMGWRARQRDDVRMGQNYGGYGGQGQ